MENPNQGSTPTLVYKLLASHKEQIQTCCTAARSTEGSLTICFKEKDNLQVINLEEIPPEFIRAFHDYATRLISEKFLLEQALPKKEA